MPIYLMQFAARFEFIRLVSARNRDIQLPSPARILLVVSATDRKLFFNLQKNENIWPAKSMLNVEPLPNLPSLFVDSTSYFRRYGIVRGPSFIRKEKELQFTIHKLPWFPFSLWSIYYDEIPVPFMFINAAER